MRPVTRFLFGTPGDFFDRHQGLLLAICCVLIVIGASS